jgi:dUTP pyrophosphatase
MNNVLNTASNQYYTTVDSNITLRRRGFEIVDKQHLKSYTYMHDVIMPKRGTKNSAGYDFFLPCDIHMPPKTSIIVWSDVKAYMLSNEVLEIYPRSSVAIKKKVRITNVVGIIDSDYYNNIDNDGNIGLALYNFGDEVQEFTKGTAIAQCIFKNFLISDNCNTEDERIGGLGSTNK